VQTHHPLTEKHVPGPLRISPTKIARAAGVGERFVGVDAEGEVEFEVFGRDGLYGREEAVAVRLFTVD